MLEVKRQPNFQFSIIFSRIRWTFSLLGHAWCNRSCLTSIYFTLDDFIEMNWMNSASTKNLRSVFWPLGDCSLCRQTGWIAADFIVHALKKFSICCLTSGNIETFEEKQRLLAHLQIVWCSELFDDNWQQLWWFLLLHCPICIIIIVCVLFISTKRQLAGIHRSHTRIPLKIGLSNHRRSEVRRRYNFDYPNWQRRSINEYLLSCS